MKEPTNNENQKPKRASKSSRASDYARYSGMAVQLGVTIAVGAFIGKSLDQYFDLERPLLTALFGLLATLAALYSLIKGLTK